VRCEAGRRGTGGEATPPARAYSNSSNRKCSQHNRGCPSSASIPQPSSQLLVLFCNMMQLQLLTCPSGSTFAAVPAALLPAAASKMGAGRPPLAPAALGTSCACCAAACAEWNGSVHNSHVLYNTESCLARHSWGADHMPLLVLLETQHMQGYVWQGYAGQQNSCTVNVFGWLAQLADTVAAGHK
jgi:hypothetical protein